MSTNLGNTDGANPHFYDTSWTTNGILFANSNSELVATSAGNTGQLVIGNTSSAPSFGTFSVNIQTFAVSGTYTPTTNMIYCVIEVVGGGGGGGGADVTTFSAGSAGGNGEYAIGTFSASTIGASQTVTIGAGGAGNSAASGSNGGTTSVGSTLISAVGGTGGAVVSTASPNGMSVAGGAGGTGGTGGNLRFPGANGGYALMHTNAAGFVVTGQGMPGRFTGGAAAITVLDGAVPQAANGNAATGYGGGGGGALDYANTSAQTGGAGSGGIVVITEYIIG